MKNLLLLGLAFTATVGTADAQKAKANLRGKNLVAVPYAPQLDGDAYYTGTRSTKASASKANNKVMAGSWGTQIGRTYYDLPSNAAVANRLVRNADGTLSAAWTETCDANQSGAGFPNRGSGYNYFDGNSWIYGITGTCSTPEKNFGVNDKRTGWPEVVVLPTGKEMLFTHNSTNGINVTSRPAKGTGGMTSWSPTTDLTFSSNIGTPPVTGNNGTWPRAVSSGNTIHLIYAINNTPVPEINGVSGPMVYNRSLDGGLTWDKTNVFLPGMVGMTTGTPATINDEGFARIGGDGYAIATRGNNVAIVAGYFGYAWTLWKSTDNGNTFTRRVISKITAADTLIINSGADTVAFTNDNSHAVIIDNAGVVHVSAGAILTKVSRKGTGANAKFIPTTPNSWFPNSGRDLWYWNDAMPAGAKPMDIATIEDSQPATSQTDWVATGGTNRTPYGTMGLVSMPNMAVDASNNVYISYTGAVEGTSNDGTQTGQPFRDIYITKRFASNGKFSNRLNISRSLNAGQAPGKSTAENFEESVFPSLAHEVGADNKVHMTFMVDYEPGMHLGSDADAELENFIMYYAFPGMSLVGMKEDISAFVNNISAFPNPTNDNVTINVDLKKNANVSVKVTNIMGQEVANVASKQMAAGKTPVKIDMNGLANGVYLYTVTSDNFTVTNRIVKQ